MVKEELGITDIQGNVIAACDVLFKESINEICNKYNSQFIAKSKKKLDLKLKIHYNPYMKNKDFFRAGQLLEVYGALLSRKQRTYLAMYYVDNCTLEEIGEKCSVSRQCVYDVINRGLVRLEKIESELGVSKMRGMLDFMKKENEMLYRKAEKETRNA